MEGGGWRVEGGEWRVEGEEWRVKSGQLLALPHLTFHPPTPHPPLSTLHSPLFTPLSKSLQRNKRQRLSKLGTIGRGPAAVPGDDQFLAGAGDADVEQAQAFADVVETGSLGRIALPVCGRVAVGGEELELGQGFGLQIQASVGLDVPAGAEEPLFGDVLVVGLRRRKVVGIDRHQIDPVPLQALGFVHRRHDHLAAVAVGVEAAVVLAEAEKTPLVACDDRELVGQLRQPPGRVLFGSLRQADGQLVRQGQVTGLSEQVLGQGQYRLVDGQQDRSLPAPYQLTKGQQLLPIVVETGRRSPATPGWRAATGSPPPGHTDG